MWPARFHPIGLVQHVLKFHPIYPSSNSTCGQQGFIQLTWFNMCQGFIQFILVLIQQVAKFHPIGLVRHVSRFHPVDKVSYLFEESSLSPVVVVVVAIPFGEDSAFESFLGGGFLLKEINAVGARNEHLVLCFANKKGNLYCEEVPFFFPF